MSEGDFLSRHGAEELANRLRSFYNAKGQHVSVTVAEETINPKRKPIYCVRSNLVRGEPPLDCSAAGQPRCVTPSHRLPAPSRSSG